MSLVLLAMPVGVAFSSLVGVNLDFLRVSSNLITIFPVVTGPISYSESESLLLQQSFFHLASCFLITFLSWPIFLLNCAKDCFMELGFLAPFFVAQKLDFSVAFFSFLQQSLVLCVVYAPLCF